MNIWFCADTHLGHGRIIDYCKRPFKDSNHMDAVIIERFNEVIRAGDILYHLGDVAWSSYNWDNFFRYFKNTHLIVGNHDKVKQHLPHPSIVWHGDLKHINPGHPIVLCHYAMRSWLGRARGAIQLYGHSHGTLPGEGRQMDVGVDTNNFYPYNLDTILARMRAIPFEQDKE